MKKPRLVGLCLGDAPEAWRAVGFDVDENGIFVVNGLVFQCLGEGTGIVGWTLGTQVADTPIATVEVDGLPTASVPVIGGAPSQAHPNGAERLDHLVVGSPNRDRTIAAFSRELGLEPRRQTEHELHGRQMVQTFFLLAPTLIEVISRPEAEGEGPSTFWGVAFTSSDLDATAAGLGPLCSPPKDAVQPGRRIATVQGEVAGLTVPLAFLTPRP